MTNREAIDHIRTWHRGGLDEMEPSALDQVLALAEAQVAMTPAPGSVEVRVAVAVDCSGYVLTRAFGKHENSSSMPDAFHAVTQTHAAIVTAWIPPVATPEVRGRVE